MSSEVLCRDGSTAEDLALYETISWWMEGVIQIVINVIGIIANLLAIPVLLSRKLTNVFNRTLAILAVFDAIFNLCDILESVRMYHGGGCRSSHIYLFPYVLYPLQNITMVASIYTTVVVAVERYHAVTRPLSAFVDDGGGKWKKVLVFIVPVLLFSFVFNIPTFFEFVVETKDTPPGHCKNNDIEPENPANITHENGQLNGSLSTLATFVEAQNYPFINYTVMRVNEYYKYYYINWTRNIITGALPIASLIIFNQLVYKKLVNRRNLWKQDTAQAQNQQSRMKSENRQAHTLFGVVTLFLIGHLFRMVLNIHEVFMDSSSDTYSQTNDSCLIDHEVRTSDTTTDTIGETESVLPTNSSISCINPNRDCIYSLTLWVLIAKTISRFLLASSFSGNLIIYCITSDVFRKVLWQQILSVYYTFRPSQNPNNRRYDFENSFAGTYNTVELTRMDRRSPLPNVSNNQHISMMKLEKRNGVFDSTNPT